MDTQRYEKVLREANDLRCKAFSEEGTPLHHALADLKMHELELIERALTAGERERPAVEAAARVRDVVESTLELELELLTKGLAPYMVSF
jgi:hypothetical protein